MTTSESAYSKSLLLIGLFVVSPVCFGERMHGLEGSAGFDTWAKCSALRGVSIPMEAIGLPTGGAIVTKATLAPAGLNNPFGEYCLVEGEIAPLDHRADKIVFSAALPSHWNG